MLVGKCSNINFENAQITANTKMAGILAGQVGAATSPGIVENVRVSGTISLTSGTERLPGITVRLVVSVQDFMVQIVKFISVHRQRILLPYGAPAVFVGKREAEQRSLNALPLGIL